MPKLDEKKIKAMLAKDFRRNASYEKLRSERAQIIDRLDEIDAEMDEYSRDRMHQAPWMILIENYIDELKKEVAKNVSDKLQG